MAIDAFALLTLGTGELLATGVMTCTGSDLMAVGMAMGDLDQLAASVQVSVQDGT